MDARIANIVRDGGAIVPAPAANVTTAATSNSTSSAAPIASSSAAVSSAIPSDASTATSSTVTSSATVAASPAAGEIPPVAAAPAASQIPAAVASPPVANQIPAAVPPAAVAGAAGPYLVVPGASLKKAGFKVVNPAAATPGQRVGHLHKALANKTLKHKHHHDGGDDDDADEDDNSDDNDNDNGDDSGDDSGDDNGDDDDSGDDGGDDSGDNDDDDDPSTSTKPGPVETVTNSTTPTLANSLAVDIEADDLGYFATVMIGTPPKPYRVTIDSGSSDFWVEGANCKAQNGDACASDHAFLSEATSSSFVNSHIPWNITYGSGAVSGDIVTDNVVIDGLSLPGHTFGTANRETSDFSAFAIPYDGLMGLGLSSGSDQGVLNPVDALAAKGLIKDAVTSYKISRAADGKHDGEITFGGMDPAKFNANTLITIPVVGKDAFWETDMDAVGVDGQTLSSRKRTAIHDTGTTGIVAPIKDADELHKLIPGAKSDGEGGYTLPCTTKSTIVLTFGGKAFPIDPRDLAEGGPVDDNDPTGECFSAIQGDVDGDDASNQWLLGDTFLKNVYLSTRATGNSTGEVSLAQLA